MAKIEISSCRPKPLSYLSDENWCPAEYDSRCMLSKNMDSVPDGVAPNCPLKKSPILLQLKAEVLNINEMFRKECEELGIDYSEFPYDFNESARVHQPTVFAAMMWILKKRQDMMGAT